MILVTGAAGFIGRHVVRRLLEQSDPVRILLMESERGMEAELPGAKPLFGDLNNPDVIQTAMKDVSAVVHLAAKNIDADGAGFQKINVEGTRNLCDEARKTGVQKFIYLSTVGVYGHHKHRDADESTPVRPDTSFSKSKAEAESIVLDHHQQGNFQGIVLRHRFVYGEGDRHVIPRMISAARKYPFFIGGGKAGISLLHAKDLAGIITRFIQSDTTDETHPVYHVTDGAPIQYRDLIHLLCDAYGFEKPTRNIPFGLLYIPVRLREWLFRIDPEVTKSSISSMRLKLVGLDNYFSNNKLMQRFPDLKLKSLEETFPELTDYYKTFIT